MPRRIPDYPDSFSGWNYISSLGSIISLVSTILFGYIVYDLFVNSSLAKSNPWSVPSFFTQTKEELSNSYESANTIEWVLPSPIPFHAFKMLPVQS